MADTQVEQGLMTIEEFIEAFDKAPFYLIDGEVLIVSPTIADHGDAQSNLMTALALFLAANKVGKIYLDTPFVQVYKRNWVKGSRAPDLMYYEVSRLNAYKAADPDYRHKPIALVPDLAVEIVSPTDSFSQVDTKIKTYLRDGVRLVWLLDLER